MDYSTTDLFLATHLVCSEIKLKTIKRTEPKKAELIFEQPPEEVLNGYFEETKKLPTRRVLNELKNLKNRIYNTPLLNEEPQ